MANQLFKNVNITGVSLKSIQPQYSQKSWSMIEIRRSSFMQQFQIEFTLQFNMNKDGAGTGEVQAFLAKYSQGAFFDFPMGLMDYSGKVTGSVTSTVNTPKGYADITLSNANLEVRNVYSI